MNTRLLANVRAPTGLLESCFLIAGPDSLLFRVVGPFFIGRYIEVILRETNGHVEKNAP